MVETLSNSESINAFNWVDFGEVAQVFDGEGAESVLNVEGKEKNREDMNRTEKLVKMQFILEKKMWNKPSAANLKEFYNSEDPDYSKALWANFDTIFRSYLISKLWQISGEHAIIKSADTTAEEQPYYFREALLAWIKTQITEEQKNSK